MKRLAFSLFALIFFCSCSVTTGCIGTITVLDSNGNTVKKWNNITIQNEALGYTSSSFKSFGLNFYDPASDQFIVLSNAVPYIIEYNTQTKVEDYDSSSSSSNTSTTPTVNENKAKFLEERQKLIDQYNELDELKATYKEQLSTLEKDSEEYNEMKALIKTTKDQMSEINKTLWYEYNYSI